MLLGAASLWAVPAHPGTRKVQQPDGTYVTIRLVGDEWCHFNTTADGYSVVQDDRGYYVYAEKKDGSLQATAHVAHDEDDRTASEREYLSAVKKYQTPAIPDQVQQLRSKIQLRQQQTLGSRRSQLYNYNYDNFKGLIILVQFNDREFSRKDFPEIFDDMVNKEGYTGFGNQSYTGSVRDYFSDNSGGKFHPQFDVVGPVTINYSQYDSQGGYKGNESDYDFWRQSSITKAAVDAVDAEVDFSQYDGDGDGKADLVFFIFAGNGSNYDGNNKGLWWPHRSIFVDPDRYWEAFKRDGVELEDYASSVELYGLASWSQKQIDGIGTICHEFSHVLGLPDFYDTDYETNGQSNDPGEWSLMSGGSYFDYSRTPAGYSLFERWAVGFLDRDPQLITKEGSYTLEALPTSYQGYRLDTPVKDEYFLFENRQKNAFKWDKYLPGSGMLVHRVDLTNKNVWKNNTVNANPAHNYYEVVRAHGVQSAGASASDVFPGTGRTPVHQLLNNTSPANLLTWSGKSNQFGLINIEMSNGVITFDVSTYKLTALTLSETLTVAIGMSQQLTETAEPSNAEYTLTWKSSDEKVATVSQQGLVTGVAEGQCTVTATSNNGIKATCKVTVVNMPDYSIDDVKKMPDGETVKMQLVDADVLFAYTKDQVETTYLRDASGAIMLSNANLGLQTNDKVSGFVFVKTAFQNDVHHAIGLGEQTNADALTIQQGSEAQPREVTLDELTTADYSDLVTVKAVQVVRDNGYWAYSGNSRARLWSGKLGIAPGINSKTKLDGKYYDITAIYDTNVMNNGSVINELEVTKAIEEVEAPTAVDMIRIAEGPVNRLYNLQGQQVNSGYKGIVIKNGRKLLMK